jgi:hypothetical protein
MRLALVFALSLLLAISATRPVCADALDATRAEAAERFDRAIRLVNAGDLSGALAEFQRAYALVPAPVVLYNVGLVYVALNRPVEAVHALDKALSGPEALKAEHAARARDALREQSDKVGQVEISTNVKEGVVEVDNVEVAKLPLPRPLEVATGAHVVGVVAAGYAPARREVLVAGRAQVQTHLDIVLVAIEGLLAHIELRCRVPAADVFVDGERVGKTPLEASVTVSPGKHQVEVRRAGYASAAREITLGDGARAELALDPSVDKSTLARTGGWLAIAASETQSVVSLDGEEIGLLRGPVQVPAGPHRLHVERGGFLAAERDVDVAVGGTTSVRVVFEPTPDTRAQYVASAESRRRWSWVTLGVGAAVAAGGVTLALLEQSQLPGAQSAFDAAVADLKPGQPCDSSGFVADPAACKAKVNDAAAKVDSLGTARTVGWVVAGVGGAVMVVGAALLLTGDDPHKYDERPTDRLFGGWRVVPQIGPGSVFVSAAARF